MTSIPSQTTLSSATLTSSEKKRIRDRRAQKTLRERRDRLLKQLEDQVAHCEEHHNPTATRMLTDMVQRQHEEVQMLRTRQQQLELVVKSLTSPELAQGLETTEGSAGARGPREPVNLGIELSPPAVKASQDYMGIGGSQHPLDIAQATQGQDACTSASHSPVQALCLDGSPNCAIDPEALAWDAGSASVEPLPDVVPAWILVPSDASLKPELTLKTCPWYSRPDLVAAAPAVPSPLHLLYGSRSNALANSIYASIQRFHVRAPEALAMGWLVYIYAKWRVARTAESFARIPTFMRPTLAQIQQLHVTCIDHVVFPELRLNLLRDCGCDIEKANSVFSLLSCCLKVRWNWGEPIVEPDKNDEMQIRESFYNTFMSVQGWGITSEFIDAYPELVEGMDISALLYPIV